VSLSYGTSAQAIAGTIAVAPSLHGVDVNPAKVSHKECRGQSGKRRGRVAKEIGAGDSAWQFTAGLEDSIRTLPTP
jgi:hypothetical protein